MLQCFRWTAPGRVARVALAAALALLALGVGRFVVDAVAFVRSPYSRDYGEGVVLALSRMLAERGNCSGDAAWGSVPRT